LVKKRRPSKHLDRKPEGRASESLTVMWMMSVVTTLVCGVVAGLVRLAVYARGGNEYAIVFARLLHFSAFVTAVVSLILLAVVLKVRSDPPPAAVTGFSLAVAILAILTALLY
jgi:hypothetical protein